MTDKRAKGRKTTDWLANSAKISARITGQTTSPNPPATTSQRIQQVAVTPTGGGGGGGPAPGGTFTLSLGVETTDDIAHDATADDVEKILRKDFKSVKRVTCEGGALGTSAVTVDFKKTTLVSVPLMTADGTNLSNALVSVVPGVSTERSWEWTEKATWSDADSDRAIMDVDTGMRLTADPAGEWRLTYSPVAFAFRHRWVYKLHAYNAQDELLLRLTMERISFENGLTPGTPGQHIVQEGQSDDLASVIADIDKWVRIGVGEYQD